MRKIWDLKLWKRKPVCVVTALFSFLMLLCVIQILRPCRQYQFEGGQTFDTGAAAPDTVVYGDISLTPGVYRVELQYDTDADLSAICTVADGTVFAGGLLCNGEHLYSGLNRTGYHMWLYEPTEALEVRVSYGGTGSLITGGLRIVETNQLWTMLLTALLALFAAVLAMLTYSYYDQAYPIAKEKKSAFFLVSLIVLAASVPYLCGYNLAGGDLTYHLQRIEGVKDGLLTGQFPVRIEPRWLYGHGYADAIFYCNTFLYFPALLRLLGFPVTAAYNAYGIAVNLATAWIAYVCFYKIFGRRSVSVLCSALYTLSIVRIYRMFITCAVGEGTALTFLPLILYGLYRIFTEDIKADAYKTAWVPLMLGVSGVLQSHVLTCEITAGVILLFCLLQIRKVFRRATFLQLLKSALASLFVSLWFLTPFVDYYLTQDLHIRNVSGRTIQDRGLYLAHLTLHFWTSGANMPMADSGMKDSHPAGVGMILVAGLAVFVILWFLGALRTTKPNLARFAKISAAAGMLLLFMSTRSFPWDRLQAMHPVAAALVSSLQIPNRTLGWASVCLVFAFGFCLCHFGAHRQTVAAVMAAAALMGITTSGMYLIDSANAGQNYLELYNEEGMGFGYISGAEYLIEGTDESRLTFSGPAADGGTEILSYEGGALQAQLECVNYTRDNSYVDLPFLLYKGYRAFDTETGQALPVCAGDNQSVRVVLPPYYSGALDVRFVSPVYWRISEGISLAALLILLLLWYRYRSGQRNAPKTAAAWDDTARNDAFSSVGSGIRGGRTSGSRQVLLWGLLAGIFVAYFPYLTNYLSLGTDTPAYLNRIAFWADALGSRASLGAFRPDDLLLWLPALSRMIGFPLMDAYKQFVFLTIALTAVCSCHALRTCVKQDYAALSGSLFCLLSPYSISCLYKRGAVAEYLAMACLFLIVCGISLLCVTDGVKRRIRGFLYVLGGAAVLLPCLWNLGCITVVFAPLCCVLLSFEAAYLVRRLMENPSPLRQTVMGVLAALFLLLAVYQVNRIALESDPAWIYAESAIELRAERKVDA
ncbi:MAG: hypothetical protein NC399_02490 [Muribaculum sp.]|nr:hypothetical protein [Muribaculum sp.]